MFTFSRQGLENLSGVVSNGACNPFLSPLGSSNLVFPLESDIVVCKTSSPSICEFSSPYFMDFEFPSNEATL
jgi:hypothetical protein